MNATDEVTARLLCHILFNLGGKQAENFVRYVWKKSWLVLLCVCMCVCVLAYISFTSPGGHKSHVTWLQDKQVQLKFTKQHLFLFLSHLIIWLIHWTGSKILGRMCYSLAPCWWCGKAAKRGRRSTRWPGWASHCECDGRTWSFGSAAGCECSWRRWFRRGLKNPARAPACTWWQPVQERDDAFHYYILGWVMFDRCSSINVLSKCF